MFLPRLWAPALRAAARRGGRFPLRTLAFLFVNRVRALVEAAEDHLARGGLQHAGHGDVDGLGDHLARVVHHHHGAVVEIGDALVVLLAFLEDEHADGFARQHHRLERIGQLVDIQHFDAAQLRDLVEVEIVGDDFAGVQLGQLDQLHVHFADVGEIVLHDLDVQLRHLLDSLQHVQPAPAAIALHGIGGIRHHLQLVQHELRDHQRAVDEPGLGDIRDAAVDNDAGIQNLEGILGGFLSPNNPPRAARFSVSPLAAPTTRPQ